MALKKMNIQYIKGERRTGRDEGKERKANRERRPSEGEKTNWKGERARTGM